MRQGLAKGLLMTILGLGLGECAFATGFSGPGYSRNVGVTVPGEGPVTLSLTRAELRGDPQGYARFWRHTRAILATLDQQPGLVGYSVRRTLGGSTVWTMTVWRDEESLRAFLGGDGHKTAVGTAMGGVERAVFARVILPRASIPLAWDDALAILDRDGYSYD